MKKLGYLWLILLAVGCHKQKEVLPQAPKILVGKWDWIAVEITLSDGTKEWKSLDSIPNKRGFIVSPAGVYLDWDGKPACCGPYGKFFVNGQAFFWKTGAKPDCSLVLCSYSPAPASCQNSKPQFQIDGDELIWTRCDHRSRYRRLK